MGVKCTRNVTFILYVTCVALNSNVIQMCQDANRKIIRFM